MKSLRLKNFRNLLDTNHIEIKPITLLVGVNGSGKSSFLRVAPLLKQSHEVITNNPLMWRSENLVDFGGFQETVRLGNINESIGFSFCFEKGFNKKNRASMIRDQDVHRDDLSPSFDWSLMSLNRMDLPETTLSVDLALDKSIGIEFIKRLEVTFGDQHISIECESHDRYALISLQVNNQDILGELSDMNNQQPWFFGTAIGLVPILYSGVDCFFQDLANRPRKKFTDWYLNRANLLLYENLKTKVSEIFHVPINSSDDDLLQSTLFAFAGILDSSDKILESYKKFARSQSERVIPKSWRKKILAWNPRSHEFNTIKNFSIAAQLNLILGHCYLYSKRFSMGTAYIGPFRGKTERYYDRDQPKIEEVKSRISDLATTLNNLTSQERNDFTQWTKENFDFSVNAEIDSNRISIKVEDGSTLKRIDLADAGSGLAQILPVIIQIWRTVNSSTSIRDRTFTIAIEQPELHLHPRLQGFLVDTIIRSVKVANEKNIELKFILETHSVVFVNRLGHQIIEGQISKDDINVVLFEKDEETGNATVKSTTYDEDGFLEYWPIGFLEPDLI